MYPPSLLELLPTLPSSIVLLDASELLGAHVPPFPPDMPALLYHLDSWEEPDALRRILLAAYPDSHPLHWYRAGKLASTDVTLSRFRFDAFSPQDALYLPPLETGHAFESFQEIVAHLRAPDGCPWDKKQTHQTLRSHLLEETYEVLDAIDAGDTRAMTEEFGDLLLQIVLHAQIASERGDFFMRDIVKGIYDKIVRRHPHVFGDLKADDVDTVLANWEKLKAAERAEKGEKEKGVLDGVPRSFPALNQAQEYQDRAARVGFDWPTVEGVLDKLNEEIEEIRQAKTPEERAYEIGDLFFVLVNFARWQGVDAESALREANARFKRRFSHIEAGARKQGRPLPDLTLDEMEALWQEAKTFE